MPGFLLSATTLLVILCGIIGGFSCAGNLTLFLVITWYLGSGPLSFAFPAIRGKTIFYPTAWMIGFIILTTVILITKSFGLTPPVSMIVIIVCAGAMAIGTVKNGIVRNDNDPADGAIQQSCLVFVITGLVLLPVFLKVGYPTAMGDAYRAYFNGDFLKHIALIHEFAKSGMPPQNPFFGNEILHYYWFIYPVAAFLSENAFFQPGANAGFIALTLTVDFVFILTLASLIPRKFRYRFQSAVILLLTIFATSYEGILLLIRIFREKKLLPEEFVHYNIDGYTRWILGHPQIDSLYRSLLYTPQHLLALSLILAGLIIAARYPSRRTALLEGLLTGISVAVSAFAGILGALALSIRIAAGLRKDRTPLWSFIPLGCCAAIFIFLSMFSSSGEHLQLLFNQNYLHVILILFINLGFLLPVGLPGLISTFKSGRRTAHHLIYLGGTAAFFFVFVRLEGNPSDVGLKAALVMIPILFYGAFRFLQNRKTVYLLVLFLAVPALFTSLMDLKNTADLSVPRYISFVSNADLAACRTITATTPEDWVVQADPNRNPSGFFSLIPTFAQRRTALGDPMHGRIFQISQQEYLKRKQMIRNLFTSTDLPGFYSLARELRLQMLYIGPPERQKFPDLRLILRHLRQAYNSQGVELYWPQAALWFKESSSGLRVKNEDTVCRRLVVFREPQKSGFSPEPEIIAMQPDEELTLTWELQSPLFCLPRLDDLGVPALPSLAEVFQKFSSTGYMVETSALTEPVWIQTNEDHSEGILWKVPNMILPPGNYTLAGDIDVESVGDVPSSWGVRFKETGEWQRQKLQDGSESLAFSVTDWTAVDLELWFNGADSVSIRGVRLEMIPPENEWLQVYSSVPATK